MSDAPATPPPYTGQVSVPPGLDAMFAAADVAASQQSVTPGGAPTSTSAPAVTRPAWEPLGPPSSMPSPAPQPELQPYVPDPYEAQTIADAPVGANQVPVSDEPRMPASPDLSIKLPRGVYDQSRRIFLTEGYVRELDGEDEEALAKLRTPAEWFDGVVALGIARMGDIDFNQLSFEQSKSLTGTLLPGEDMMVYLKVVTATFGPDRDIKYQCQNARCGREIETSLHIPTDFPVSLPEGDYLPTYAFQSSKGKVTYRLITSSDEAQLLAASTETTTSAEMTSAALVKSIIAVNGLPPQDPDGFVRSLSIRDRQALLEVIASRQPKIDMSLSIECVCGFHNRFLLALPELFRP